MNVIERSACVLSGQADLEHLYTFERFPVFMGCLDQPPEADLVADMGWWISRGTGLIQLKKLLPLEVLYQEAHGSGAVGALWRKHHSEFARFLNKWAPKAVFEIGGAHGILAKYHAEIADIPWTILEPNPSPVEGCPATFIEGFFSDQFVFDGDYDCLVHSHLFEHICEPDEFMRHLSSFMEEGKRLIFSLPNMQVMLERKYTNCINFEHTVFLTEPYIEYLLAKHGFQLLEKRYFMDDHSIFYAAVRAHEVAPRPLPEGLYDRNMTLYLDYIKYHQDLIGDLNRALASVPGPVFLFGAHVFAQYLISFGLDVDRIECLLDNDPNKQGRRLYGTNLMVRSPACLKGLDSPSVILKAGVYNDEIRRDILDNINASVNFLE